MSVNSVQGPFSKDHKVTLQNRGKNSSGITFELKSVFEELAKQGKLQDSDNKGLTKEDALNLYNKLDAIHKQTNRATNYTKMSVGQEFTYTADEMNALAKAAGYKIVEESSSNKHADDKKHSTGKGNSGSGESEKSGVEITKEAVIKNVKENGGKVIRRDVDGLKQDIAVYKPSGSKAKIRRTFNTKGELGPALVTTKSVLNNDYVTVKEDDTSLSLGEMKLKKVKVDGSKEKEYIVRGKTTDGTNEVQYYKFIPKTGHAESDGQNNRLGERVYKVNGKYVTSELETTEKSDKKGSQKSSKKTKNATQTSTDYDYQADYAATQKKIAAAMNSDMTPAEAIESVFDIKEKKVEKMLKEIREYCKTHDINTDESKQSIYDIAKKYGVRPAQLQAFLDTTLSY